MKVYEPSLNQLLHTFEKKKHEWEGPLSLSLDYFFKRKKIDVETLSLHPNRIYQDTRNHL